MTDIDDLRDRINASSKNSSPTPGDEDHAREESSVTLASATFRYATEFVAAVLVGLAIGYFIDHYFDTAPWGLLIWLALGMAAGVLSMVRAYRTLTESNQSGKSSSTSSDRN